MQSQLVEMQDIVDELFVYANNGGPVRRIEDLVTGYQIDINSCWKDEYSLLMVAANSGDIDLVRSLIKLGADVNASSETGYTALMEAAKWNQLRMIEILLASGAVGHLKDQHGRTARIIAAQYGNKDVISLLKGIPMEITKEPKKRIHHFVLQVVPSAPPSPVPPFDKPEPEPDSPCSVPAAVLSDVSFVPLNTLRSEGEGEVKGKGGASDGQVNMVGDLLQFGKDVVEILSPLTPAAPQPEQQQQPTWLHRRLSSQGLAPPLIALCEQKLIHQEGFTSEALFARLPPDSLTHEHLRQVGIEPMAARFMVLSLHKHIRDKSGFVWE